MNLKHKLDVEMQTFRATHKAMTSAEVYDHWYRICFHEEYYQMLTSPYINQERYKDILEWLNKFEKPLSFLYDEWLSCDGALCLLWDDMIAWLQDLKDEEEVY